MATTGNRDNDTPVQSQVERDKTVATNEGSWQRTCRGGETPVELIAISRLMDFKYKRQDRFIEIENPLYLFKPLSCL